MSLADMIENAKRTIAEWPPDVRRAMGLEPVATAVADEDHARACVALRVAHSRTWAVHISRHPYAPSACSRMAGWVSRRTEGFMTALERVFWCDRCAFVGAILFWLVVML